MRKYTKELLEQAIKDSICFSDVCRNIGISPKGNSYQRLKILIEEYELDTSHFINARLAGMVKSGLLSKKLHFSEILVDGKKYREQGKRLRRALIESGRSYECVDCKLGPIWNGKEIILHVDHINGDWRDCRVENLRFLCPNCHSQTSTFGSKKHFEPNKCNNCNVRINKGYTWCVTCSVLFIKRKRKVENRPALDVLIKEINQTSYEAVGRKYGVTGNTIKKWVKIETKRLDR